MSDVYILGANIDVLLIFKISHIVDIILNMFEDINVDNKLAQMYFGNLATFKCKIISFIPGS